MYTARERQLIRFALAYIHANRRTGDLEMAFDDEFCNPITDAEYQKLFLQFVNDDEPVFPYVKITDIAKAIGRQPEVLVGDISACANLQIPLADGKVLMLQTGDTPDHYRIEQNAGDVS